MSGIVERLRADEDVNTLTGPTATELEAADTIEVLERDLAECYRLSGADPDGDSDSMLAHHAVLACREGRKEWDECADELLALEKRLAEVEGARDREQLERSDAEARAQSAEAALERLERLREALEAVETWAQYSKELRDVSMVGSPNHARREGKRRAYKHAAEIFQAALTTEQQEEE